MEARYKSLARRSAVRRFSVRSRVALRVFAHSLAHRATAGILREGQNFSSIF